MFLNSLHNQKPQVSVIYNEDEYEKYKIQQLRNTMSEVAKEVNYSMKDYEQSSMRFKCFSPPCVFGFVGLTTWACCFWSDFGLGMQILVPIATIPFACGLTYITQDTVRKFAKFRKISKKYFKLEDTLEEYRLNRVKRRNLMSPQQKGLI